MIYDICIYDIYPLAFGPPRHCAQSRFQYPELYRKRPVEYRRPLPFGVLSAKKREEIFWRALKLDTDLFNKVFKKNPNMYQKRVPKTMKIMACRGSGRSWKRSWHENSLGCCLGRFWAASDRPKSRPNCARWPQVGANMAPRWSKLDSRWPSWGHLKSHLVDFGGSWERSLQKWQKCKNEQHYCVLATFWYLGKSIWRLFGPILGDLGYKFGSLGLCWCQVGNFFATCCD